MKEHFLEHKDMLFDLFFEEVSREMKKSESVLSSLLEVPRDSELPVKIQEEVSERMK